MSDGWTMKKGDLLPELDVILRDGYDAVDLSGATSATLQMALKATFLSGGTPEVTGTVDIDADQSNNTGRVTYTWVSGDTDDAGEYYAEFQVLYGTKTITYPNDGYYIVEILDDVSANA